MTSNDASYEYAYDGDAKKYDRDDDCDDDADYGNSQPAQAPSCTPSSRGPRTTGPPDPAMAMRMRLNCARRYIFRNQVNTLTLNYKS